MAGALLGGCTLTTAGGTPLTLSNVTAAIGNGAAAADKAFVAACPVLPTVEQVSNALGAATGVNVAGNGYINSTEAVLSIMCATLAPTPTVTAVPIPATPTAPVPVVSPSTPTPPASAG